MKYSLVSNMKYVCGVADKANKKLRLYMICNFIASLLRPILESFIVSSVVFVLTNHISIEKFILVLLLLVLLSIILDVLQVWSSTRYSWEDTFIRCNEFWIAASEKAISDKYDRIEPISRQRVVSKAFEALQSNWMGIERMLKETPVVILNIVGMIVFAVLISIYSPWVLLVLVVMTIVNYFITKRANIFLEKKQN